MKPKPIFRRQEILRPVEEQPVEPINSSPRWEIGIDRKRVGAYVAVALIAGFAMGYGFSGYTARMERPQERPGSEIEPAARSGAGETAASGFHQVVGVPRADTIEVESVGPVRMIGIETPDGKSPREIYEVHGQQALSFVQRSLLGREVRIEFDPANAASSKEGAGVTIAYVVTRDGTLFNREMVKQGHAFVRVSEPFRLAEEFRALEREAMQAMRGVWGLADSSASSAASTLAPQTAAGASSEPGDKTRRLTPLAPSELGPNIPALSGSSSAPEQPVFVSPADRMYHKSGCEYLGKKSRAIAASQAKSEGYTACGRCFASTVLKAP